MKPEIAFYPPRGSATPVEEICSAFAAAIIDATQLVHQVNESKVDVVTYKGTVQTKWEDINVGDSIKVQAPPLL